LTETERNIGKRYKDCWDKNKFSWEDKMDNFAKYVQLPNLFKFLGKFELFKKILNIEGSIVEGGVFQGGGMMSWAKISSILEPASIFRRVYGFDTFEGYPQISDKDFLPIGARVKSGDYYCDSYDELKEIIKIYNSSRPSNYAEKVFLIKGDACKAIPAFVKDNPYVAISLLYLEFDLYEPTKVAIKYLYPRIPKGGIIGFGDFNKPGYPGVTIAVMEELGIGNLKFQKFNFDSNLSYAIKE